MFVNTYLVSSSNSLEEILIREKEKQLEKERELECCICLEDTEDKIDCNHILCRQCYQKFQLKDCPICFRKIEIFKKKKKQTRRKRSNVPYLLPKLK
jgi:hypothetical protein